MQLFNRANKGLRNTVTELTAQVKALQSTITSNLAAQLGTSFLQYPDWNQAKNTDFFVSNIDVYSVVSKIAENTASIPRYTYFVKPDATKHLRRYEMLRKGKDIFATKMSQVKALEDAPDTDPLQELLNNPNDYQTAHEFDLLLGILYMISGEVYIYKERAELGANAGKPIALHIFPGINTKLHISGTFPYYVTGYDFEINGRNVISNVPDTDVIPIKMPNPVLDIMGGHLRGLSPLKAGCATVTRMNTSTARATAVLKNGGVPGIVYNESIGADDMDQQGVDKWKEALMKHVNNDNNTNAPFPSGGKLGYVQLGLKLADMELIELEKLDFKKLCNVYRISTIMFNSDAASTESNVREMVSQMYVNACLPLADAVNDAYNKYLVPDFKDKKRYVSNDLSEIPALQIDMQKTATAIAALPGGYSLNEVREVFGWDTDPDPLMDKKLLKQGYIYIDETTMLPPIQNDPQLNG